MSENTVQQLPSETVKLLTSTQIVTSVSTAVKELLENSIDAGAKIIQVRLENYGLDLIEIKDNGSGVSYDNVQRMFLPGYTSKIKQFEDLDKLSSYGFRGEALAAICKIGKVTITTKTIFDSLAMTYDIDSTGVPSSSKPSHLNNGTVITITNLFSNLPVRKSYLSTKKKTAEEMKLTEQVVQSLSLIHPELNVSLIHNKCIVWKKNSVRGLKQSFMQVATLKTVCKMDHISKSINSIHLELIIPKKNLSDVNDIFTNSNSGMFVYINKRPVTCKYLSQPVQEHIFHHYARQNVSQKYAVSLISVDVPSQLVDINLEPNKTKVLLKNQTDVIKIIDEVLINYYNNENFHCTALRKAVIEEEPVEEMQDASAATDDVDLPERHEVKRPRLECEDIHKSAKEKKKEEFTEKNIDWKLEIINENNFDLTLNSNEQNILNEENHSSQKSNNSDSLCSQINKSNCILTTADEVSELNAKLNEQSFPSLIFSNSKNSVTRLVERNDLQSQPSEIKILPEWPLREVNVKTENIPLENGIAAGTQENFELTESSEARQKNAEEIAAEMENNVDQWSMEMCESTRSENSERSEPSDDHISNFDLSVQSISSQMGKKEMKAFTKFTRIMRPKIADEFPKLGFTQVAAILAERWKSLSPAEVKYYEKMAEIVDFNRQIYQEEKSKELSKESVKSGKPSGKNADLRSFLEVIRKRSKISRPPRREISLITSMREIKESRRKGSSGVEGGRSTGGQYELIGQLIPSRAWLYSKGKEIGHLRHRGLQEMITYQKMLSSHSVPRRRLEKPIPVNEFNLGSSLWKVFVSLQSEFCPESSSHVLTGDLISKNGFRIEVEKREGLTSGGIITEVASSIPQFGILDLKDVLGLYLKNGEIGGSASWRPISVCSYLTNEAIRLNQQRSSQPDREEMEEILNTYHSYFSKLPPICLHSKEIFVPIYHIQD